MPVKHFTYDQAQPLKTALKAAADRYQRLRDREGETGSDASYYNGVGYGILLALEYLDRETKSQHE